MGLRRGGVGFAVPAASYPNGVSLEVNSGPTQGLLRNRVAVLFKNGFSGWVYTNGRSFLRASVE